MNRISIQLRIIVSLIFFIFTIVALERYYISQNVKKQFKEDQRSKHELLITTLLPVLSLNMSLGLEEANEEYLDKIFDQNNDIAYLEVSNNENIVIYVNTQQEHIQIVEQADGNELCMKDIADPLTNEKLGKIKIYFQNDGFKNMVLKNQITTLKIVALTSILLILFILYLKKEFKELKELTSKVMEYDPKINNFDLEVSKREDEVGIIQNAIVMMVKKIASYTKLLDDMNRSLEQKVQERTEELEKLNKLLQEQSLTDPLTHLPNRRHFEKHAQEIWSLAKREEVSVSVIMCDIDFFKQVNDKYGHPNGDKVLIELSKILKNSLRRDTDFVARYGGEEFIIILYKTDSNEAQELCKNIQNNISESLDLDFYKDTSRPISMSFGISSTIPQDIELSKLIDASDQALYIAKEDGRDCIRIKTLM